MIIRSETLPNSKPVIRWPQLNVMHPLAQGLAAAWVINEGNGTLIRNLVDDQFGATLGSTAVWHGNQFIRTDGAATATMFLPSRLWIGPDLTVICKLSEDVWANDNIALGGHAYNDGGYGFYFDTGALIYSACNGDYAGFAVSPPTLVDGQVYTLGFTKQGIVGQLYVDGRAVGIDSTFDAASLMGIDTLSGYDTATNCLDGDFYFSFAWNRALSANEVASFSADPNQIFRFPRLAYNAAGAAVANAPTGVFYGPLVGALGGPL